MKGKWIALLLAMCMILSLAACGFGSGSTPTSETADVSVAEAQEPSEVTVPEPAPDPVEEPQEEAPEEPEEAAEDIPEEPESVAGTYVFEEAAMNGAFIVPWTLELLEDGTYNLTEENPFMGTSVHEGEYTFADGVITTGPFEGVVVADFFEEDGSCQWTLDGETCTPVNYSGGALAAFEIENGFAAVPYGDLSGSQIMDIYLPEGAGTFPVIVLVHGGGFALGDQRMTLIQPVIEYATANGYAVASVDYRKSSAAVFPAALSDVKAAVRFLRANSEAYSIDPEKIAIWGESAGAYLSLMTALTPEVEELNGDMTENLDQSSAVSALVDFYGPVEFYTMDEEAAALGMNASFGEATSFESQFLGQPLTEDEEKTYTTYWETYKEQLPADFTLKAWIQVGDSDSRVPCTQSEHFGARLPDVIGTENVQFSFIEGADHEDPLFYTEENLKDVLEFLDSVMK